MISSWPDAFCEALADAGFHVVRYDHRDAGLSTPSPVKKAYELTDMVDDMMVVLDAMGWESANLAACRWAVAWPSSRRCGTRTG